MQHRQPDPAARIVPLYCDIVLYTDAGAHAVIRPALSPRTLGLLALGLAISLIGPPRVLASTVVVPDDSSTVSAAIASGADTVLVREGTYTEVPVVERSLVLRGIGAGQRPRLNGLALSNLNASRTSVSGFDISNTVVYSNAANKSPITVTLSECSLDNGIQVNADDPDAHCSLVLNRCRLRYVTGGLDDIHMDADTLDGAVTLTPWSNPVVIQNCWFRGGTGPAITLRREPYSTYIAHNRIENYSVSISAPEAGLTMDGNTISGCGTGIEVGREGYIWNNVIRDCGVGIHCNGGSLQLINNTILNASGDGISVKYPDGLQARGNIVGYCGGNGIVLDADHYQAYGVDVRNNTIFDNRGSGIVLSLEPFSATVRANIGYGNAGWGLTTQPGAQIALGCNNWFQNGSGATSGVAMDPSDLSVDPMFCDVAGADVKLSSGSPLLNATGCGQIGALGVGCGATPTLVQRFSAARMNNGVRVVWQVAPGATESEIWVERAEGVSGEAWTRPPMVRSIEGQAAVEVDHTALPDRAYRYRLVAVDVGGLTVLDPGVLIGPEARLAFGLRDVGPSPGGGPLRVTFALANAAEIRIDVFDLLGRRIATPAQGTWPAGTQVVAWDGLTHAGRTAPAGMYVIHYRYPGGTEKRPVVRVP